METLKDISKAFEKSKRISFDQLRNSLKCSERKVRELIMQLRSIEAVNGFQIQTVRGIGYELVVTDEQLYQNFLDKINEFRTWNYDDQQQRVRVMVVVLLLSDRVLTLDELSHVIDVSRSTVLRDLEVVKELVEDEGLSLVSQRYHGVKILGDEHSKRKMLNRLTLDNADYEDLFEEYWEFLNRLSTASIRDVLGKSMASHSIEISDEGMNTLVNHVTVMLYRLKNGNVVSEFTMDDAIVTAEYIVASQEIMNELQNLLSFQWNINEVKLFATQILGCATINAIPDSVHKEISSKIEKVLRKLDREFEMNFSLDGPLKEALTHHVYPLLLRGRLKLRLKNPIRHIIPIRYMNSVLIALRFVGYYNINDQTAITPDEIGYLALHFATYFERMHQVAVNNVQRILYVASNTRSNILLNKARLSEIFPNGIVTVQSIQTIEQDIPGNYDVIIMDKETCVNSKIKQKAYPISYIITDDEIAMIKHELILESYSLTRLSVDQLFKEELFFFDESNDDYLTILKKYAKQLVHLNYASKDFAKSVIERELKFSTVYESGIAAPHSMNQNAFIDSVAVVYLKNHCEYMDKTVKIIFLINIKKGHLFLYQDISDLIIWAIENESLIDRCFRRKDFQAFIQLLKERA